MSVGGRGASSGISVKGKPYGSEYTTILSEGNIKFIRQNFAKNAKDPLETMTRGRVYVTINDKDEINSINYYGIDGKRVKTINLLHSHDEISGAHTHIGYFHKEFGTRHLTEDEKRLVAFVKRIWYNRHSK